MGQACVTHWAWRGGRSGIVAASVALPVTREGRAAASGRLGAAGGGESQRRWRGPRGSQKVPGKRPGDTELGSGLGPAAMKGGV